MANEEITTSQLAELVRPVRALLKGSQKILAIKLVRERTNYDLKESKDLVDFVAARPGTKSRRVAELWIGRREDHLVSFEVQPTEPGTTPIPGSAKNGKSTTRQPKLLAEWYARYMQAHTYSDWEQLVEECIAITQTERQSKTVMKRRVDGNN